jgi:hypothetical protein
MSSGFNGVAQGFLGGAGGGSGLPTGGVEGDVLTLDENLNAVWASVTPPLSPEVQVAIAYSNLVGLDSTQRQAAIDLANAQLVNNYRDKIVGMWIFKAGTTVSQKLYNFVDPSNFAKITESGTPAVVDADGIELANNGATILTLPYLPSDLTGYPYIGLGIIQPDALDVQFLGGHFRMQALIDGNDVYLCIGNSSAQVGAIQAVGTGNKLKPYWQRDGTACKFYNAAVERAAATITYDAPDIAPMQFFFRNNGVAGVVSALFLVKALTPTDVGNLNADLSTFLLSL